MANRNVHVWKSVAQDGVKREVRAEKFAGKWKFQAKRRDEEDWTYYDAPPMEDLVELRDILWRKYQRKRLPFEDVSVVDRLIREQGGDPLAAARDETDDAAEEESSKDEEE